MVCLLHGVTSRPSCRASLKLTTYLATAAPSEKKPAEELEAPMVPMAGPWPRTIRCDLKALPAQVMGHLTRRWGNVSAASDRQAPTVTLHAL